MEKRYEIIVLNKDSVVMKTVDLLVFGGNTYEVNPTTVSYVNSEEGRALVNKNVAEPYRTAIMNIWGTTATVPTPAPSVKED